MAKIRKISKHGNARYEVDLGRIAGKRRRRYEKTATGAQTRMRQMQSDLRALGNAWDNLESKRKHSILTTLQEIRDHGLTIEDVWQKYKETQLSSSTITLDAAVNEYLEIKSNSGWRERFASEMIRTLHRFAQGREKRSVASVGHGEIAKWIQSFEGSDSTRLTMQRRVGVFFAWAKRQAYIAANPMERIESIRIDQAEPEILSVAQCRRLIQACRELDKPMLPYFALSLFLGVRPEECMRIDKTAIDLERNQVTIAGEVAKTRNRRVITMNDPARRIFEKMKKSDDWKTNFRRRRTAIRKAAKIKHWPKDVLRHTAASHFYNIFGMDEATKQLGHSAAIMLRHYRQLVSKEETKEWLGI